MGVCVAGTAKRNKQLTVVFGAPRDQDASKRVPIAHHAIRVDPTRVLVVESNGGYRLQTLPRWRREGVEADTQAIYAARGDLSWDIAFSIAEYKNCA